MLFSVYVYEPIKKDIMSHFPNISLFLFSALSTKGRQ